MSSIKRLIWTAVLNGDSVLQASYSNTITSVESITFSVVYNKDLFLRFGCGCESTATN